MGLKRTTPLKRTQLTSRTKLESRKPLRSQKRIPGRSKKAEKLYREKRRPLVEKLLSERPWCEACALFAELDGHTFYRVRPASDLHEVRTRGRTGGIHSTEWLDPDNVKCLCRPCHQRITEDRDGEATALGLLA